MGARDGGTGSREMAGQCEMILLLGSLGGIERIFLCAMMCSESMGL